MPPNELTYFTVVGHWYDVEAPLTSGTTSTPQTMAISAFVTFTPRLAPGTVVYVPNLDEAGVGENVAVPIAPIPARIYEGVLSTINTTDTPNVQLLANSPILGLTSLIYDVAFTHVTYAGANQVLTNFAFTAPTTATTVDLTDPALTRLPYNPTGY